jgi:hypothetical protein
MLKYQILKNLLSIDNIWHVYFIIIIEKKIFKAVYKEDLWL